MLSGSAKKMFKYNNGDNNGDEIAQEWEEAACWE